MSPDHENRDAALAAEEAARLALSQLSADLAAAHDALSRALGRKPGVLLAGDIERARAHVDNALGALRRAEKMREVTR